MAHSQSYPSTSFNRSALVQLLASLQIPAVADFAQTCAQQLSHWVAWKDAIGLSSALDANPIAGPSLAAIDKAAVAAVTGQLRRVREELAAAIADDALLAADAPGAARRPVAAVNAADDGAYM